MNSLFIYGCSHSAGHEIPNEKFWGYLLSQRLNLHLVDSTNPGHGLGHIISSLFRDIYNKRIKKGDVVIGISTSGNSLNVKKGLLTSKKLSATTIGLLGKNGSIKKIVDISLSVQCKTTPEIQEAHRVIYHIICEHIEKKLMNKNKK